MSPLAPKLFLALLLTVAAVANGTAADRTGHLVLVGGGPTPADVFTRTLGLSGGRSAIVVVLPQTYPNDTIADTAVTMWQSLGVRDVVKVSRTDEEAARAAVARATLIWIPGGFQGRFMKAIADTTMPDLIRARFAAGVTIGGSSAGAAAVSRVMVADETTPDGSGIDGPRTDEGLGLWPEAVVSPHFSERRRLNGLMAIVKEHPELTGVGIDEGTAVIVFSGAEIDVVGRGGVTIVDGRRSSVRTLRSGAHVRFLDFLGMF